MANKDLLIVDDEILVCESLKEMLSLEGYTVDAVPDGAAALAKIKEDRYQLIISDIRMPGLNGIELLKIVKRRYPDLKWRQTPAEVEELSRKQAAILSGAAKLIKPGGRLVYATCSILAEENNDVADAFLAANQDFVLCPAGEVLSQERIDLPMGEYFELWPHRHGTDGFFAAVLERRR